MRRAAVRGGDKDLDDCDQVNENSSGFSRSHLKIHLKALLLKQVAIVNAIMSFLEMLLLQIWNKCFL